MRIGVFTDSYIPYTSGVVTSILSFKEELTKMGHDVYIFAPSYPNFEDKDSKVFRFFSLPAPTKNNFSLAFPLYPGLNLIIKNLKLDIIHVHSPFIMGRVGKYYAKKYHLPLVFTYHTRYDQYVHYVPIPQEIAKDLTIKYATSFCSRCDHVIVPSHDIEEIIREFKINTPFSIIPTGVQLDKFSSGNHNWLKNNYGIPTENKVLLFVGRLCREKNIPFLIDAFKILKQIKPDTTLVITASGPLEKELKEYTKAQGFDLEDEVIFTGAIPFDQLKDVYHSADLFVFSSLTETQGLVLIEAMAAGLPVVAVKASGVRDMVDHNINGILCEHDTREFAEAINYLLNNDLLYKQFQAQAKEKAERLSSYNMTLKLIDIYQQLLDNNKHSSYYRTSFSFWPLERD